MRSAGIRAKNGAVTMIALLILWLGLANAYADGIPGPRPGPVCDCADYVAERARAHNGR